MFYPKGCILPEAKGENHICPLALTTTCVPNYLTSTCRSRVTCSTRLSGFLFDHANHMGSIALICGIRDDATGRGWCIVLFPQGCVHYYMGFSRRDLWQLGLSCHGRCFAKGKRRSGCTNIAGVSEFSFIWLVSVRPGDFFNFVFSVAEGDTVASHQGYHIQYVEPEIYATQTNSGQAQM